MATTTHAHSHSSKQARLLASRRLRRAEQALLGPRSRRQLAASTGLHPSHVARILRGERGLDIQLAVVLAKALGLELDVFVRRLTALQEANAEMFGVKTRDRGEFPTQQ